MDFLGSYWMHFHDICYLRIFKISDSLIAESNISIVISVCMGGNTTLIPLRLSKKLIF